VREDVPVLGASGVKGGTSGVKGLALPQ